MADLSYLLPNQLRQQVRNERRLLLLLGIPILGVTAIFRFILFGLGLGLRLIVLAVIWRRHDQRLHGALGEDMALGQPQAYPGSLVGLLDTYVIYNQVRIPWGNRTGNSTSSWSGRTGSSASRSNTTAAVSAGVRRTRTGARRSVHARAASTRTTCATPWPRSKAPIYPLKQYLASQYVRRTKTETTEEGED